VITVMSRMMKMQRRLRWKATRRCWTRWKTRPQNTRCSEALFSVSVGVMVVVVVIVVGSSSGGSGGSGNSSSSSS